MGKIEKTVFILSPLSPVSAIQKRKDKKENAESLVLKVVIQYMKLI